MKVVFIEPILHNMTESFLKRLGHGDYELLKNEMYRFAEDMIKQTHCLLLYNIYVCSARLKYKHHPNLFPEMLYYLCNAIINKIGRCWVG